MSDNKQTLPSNKDEIIEKYLEKKQSLLNQLNKKDLIINEFSDYYNNQFLQLPVEKKYRSLKIITSILIIILSTLTFYLKK